MLEVTRPSRRSTKDALCSMVTLIAASPFISLIAFWIASFTGPSVASAVMLKRFTPPDEPRNSLTHTSTLKSPNTVVFGALTLYERPDALKVVQDASRAIATASSAPHLKAFMFPP